MEKYYLTVGQPLSRSINWSKYVVTVKFYKTLINPVSITTKDSYNIWKDLPK